MTTAEQPYPDVPVQADYPAIERRILADWEANDTFAQSVEQREGGDNEYVFYDGPPFANGLPHYGHLLTGYVKDVIPRFHAMRGRRVERRFGWDCHGLPAEMESEKELGVSGRRAITEYGIDNFNEHCRNSVLRYTTEWESYVTRQARWVSFENDYKTMDVSYMESVIWAFKQLWDKGLVYEAYRVMPYSWGAETPLSNFEIRLDDATRPRQDPAITVMFELDEPLNGVTTNILAWTTTPWTLPSNLALAVGPDIDYVVVEENGIRYLLAEAVLENYAAQLTDAERVTTMKGSDLVGLTYKPIFPYFEGTEGVHRILGVDFIDTTEGTGVVHMAPGFGEDDQAACAANGIELIERFVPVDDEGRFTADIVEWAGMNVFDANPEIIRHLRDSGQLLRHDSYEHNYPHCWRTDTPIIYRALTSWYVRVSDLNDDLLAHNAKINWIPEHVRDGAFGRWLEGARDWSISRNRFWGAPIPVWRSDDPAYPRIDVYGSLDEIEADFGVRPADLHRPTIDNLVRPNPDDPTGQSMMRRVPEVLDCWFESGSMPFAQVHYPFENQDWFESHSPADFIVEYIAQTRGWFYTMHVLSVALFDRPAFSNAIGHGVVLDHEGKKLSKRLRNYPDPEEVFESIGSDALRWYLMASSILRGGDLRIDRDGAGMRDSVRLVLNPIWNAFHFFTLYANIDGHRAERRSDSPELLDRYILAKTRQLVEEMTERLEAYDLAGATVSIASFLDALNNWYIRRSRDRFWAPNGGDNTSKRWAYDTLYTVLHNLTRVAAPLLPMVTEEIYQGLTGEESIHLTDWPDADELPNEPVLVADMDRIREIASAALSLRESHGLRARLPLQTLTVAGDRTTGVEALSDLLAEEVNVKRVSFTDDVASYGSFVLKPNGKILGPKLGKDVQEVIKAARAGEWSVNDDDSATVAGHTLAADEFELALDAREGQATAPLRGNSTVVNLDTNVTAQLRDEGTVRDLIRSIQQARKDLDLAVTDRIAIELALPTNVIDAVRAHERSIADQVLAVSVQYVDEPRPIAARVEAESGPVDVTIAIELADLT